MKTFFHLGATLFGAFILSSSNISCSSEDLTAEDDIKEKDALFGDDRVSDVLKGHLEKVPRTYAEAEKLFGIGRECARTDSKEVYVVEESQTRDGGTAHGTSKLLPRTIITGCNAKPGSNPLHPLYDSFSLMVALFSVESQGSDPMLVSRVETIALDRKTGLYNFYVFRASEKPGDRGTMERIRLAPNNDVIHYIQNPLDKKPSKFIDTTRSCNSCHINMGPLMNEMHEPWTNWISSQKTLPKTAKDLSGETRSIVNESIAIDGSHQRKSFADDLETTMTAAIQVWNNGDPAIVNSGYVGANLDLSQPARLAGLLKSVFCQTELQYKSSTNLYPMELFAEPAVFGGEDLVIPPQVNTTSFPTLMPIRSQMDKKIERALMVKKVLLQNTVRAIRLIDPRNDVFSDYRCGFYQGAVAALPKDPEKNQPLVDAALRKYLVEKVLPTIADTTQKAYMRALLTLDSSDPEISTSADLYKQKLATQLKTDFKKVESKVGRNELKTFINARKNSATKMFTSEAVPLPLLPLETLEK